MVNEMRARKQEELDALLTEIIHKANEAVMDRLRNGDFVMVGGELKRKPVAAKEAAIIGAVSFDKRQLGRNMPTTITSKESSRESLHKLAEKFREIARKTEQERTIDVTPEKG